MENYITFALKKMVNIAIRQDFRLILMRPTYLKRIDWYPILDKWIGALDFSISGYNFFNANCTLSLEEIPLTIGSCLQSLEAS